MAEQSIVAIGFEPSVDFTSKLQQAAELLRQVPKSVAREVLGDLDGVMLKLGSCDLGPAIHTSVGRVVFRFTFTGIDELLAAARRAYEGASHG